jgi:hypothetical protein
MVWAAFVLAGSIGLALVEPAPESLRLQWSAPASCPTRDDVAARIASQLRTTSPERPLVDVHADIRVEQSDDGFVAQLRVTTPTGITERTLSAITCAVIVDASALIVAMAADTAAAERVVEPAVPPKASKPRAAVWGIVAAGGGIGIGGVAPIGGVIGGLAGLTTYRVRFEIEGRYAFARHVRHDVERNVGGEVSVWTIGPRVGPVLHVGKVEFPLLVGADVGQARGAGFGVTQPRVARRPWLSVGLFPAVVWRVTQHLGLGLAAEIDALIVRPRFALGDVGTLPAPFPIAGAVRATIEGRFR